MKNLIATALGSYLNTTALIAPKLAGSHGFKIWCYPFRTPMKTYHKEFLNSADKFSFQHNNTRIQGYRWGDGAKKVLFLHGWQSHSFRWKNYIQALPHEEYTIYAIDAPGHGLSGGKMLNVVIYSGVIQQFIEATGEIHAVVAHSIGSFSILHALHHTPFLPVNRLVLMAPPGNASDFILVLKEKLKLKDRTIRATLDYFEKTLKKSIDYYSTESFASSLTIPGLIVHDLDDDETPYSHALKVNQAWKNSALVTTSGLKHNLKSTEVTTVVNNYIEAEKDAIDKPITSSHH